MIERKIYLDRIIPLIDDPLIKIITGMRRVGKSTFLLLIQKELIKRGVSEENIISINFESLTTDNLKNYKNLYNYVSKKIKNDLTYYIFLDEIQEVEGFEKVVNSLNVDFNVDIYITGSNSKMLSGELATYLTGRYFSINIYPLSFKEIYSYYNSQKKVDKDTLFLKYVNQGGLPATYRFSDKNDLINGYLEDMYSSILLKDIVTRYNVRDIELLQRFLKFVFNNVGQIFSASSITKFLRKEGRKLSKETIYNYISACKEAYLIHSVSRYNLKGKEILKTKEKYFINDLGLRSIYFDNESDINQTLENIVFLELLRKGYNIYVGDIDGFEVDFIAEKNNEKIYLQVTYLLADNSVIEREFNSLEKIEDNFPKYVVSMDKVNIQRKGIKQINIIDFLLEE
jgi:hypothetical protein